MTGVGSVFNRANVQPGDHAAVFGAGGVGLSVIQALRINAAGAIIAVDTLASKLALAMELGATHFIDAGQGDAVAQIREIVPWSAELAEGPFAGGGVNWSFECVGHPAVTDSAVRCLDWGGTCVQVGVPAPGVTYAIPITHLTQVDRGIIGSPAGGVRAQKDIPIIVDMYKKLLAGPGPDGPAGLPDGKVLRRCQGHERGQLARGAVTF